MLGFVKMPNQSRRNYAVERWAAMVDSVLGAVDDPRTLVEWGRLCGLSASSIKVRCRTAGLRPKTALDFCRLLRIVVSDEPGTRDRRTLGQLDIIDERTIRRLLRRVGISSAVLTGATPCQFLASQVLITEPDYLSVTAKFTTAMATSTSEKRYV